MKRVTLQYSTLSLAVALSLLAPALHAQDAA